MEIHKLDKTEAESEAKKSVLKGKPDQDSKAFSLKESWKRLPKGRLLAYGTSADTSGDTASAVGYAAVGVSRGSIGQSQKGIGSVDISTTAA